MPTYLQTSILAIKIRYKMNRVSWIEFAALDRPNREDWGTTEHDSRIRVCQVIHDNSVFGKWILISMGHLKPLHHDLIRCQSVNVSVHPLRSSSNLHYLSDCRHPWFTICCTHADFDPIHLPTKIDHLNGSSKALSKIFRFKSLLIVFTLSIHVMLQFFYLQTYILLKNFLPMYRMNNIWAMASWQLIAFAITHFANLSVSRYE
jgi:hypothetical protein